MRRVFPSESGEQGFALVLVIWFAGLMSVVALAYAYSVRSYTRSASSLVERARAEYLADAGIMLAIRDIKIQKLIQTTSETRFRPDAVPRTCRVSKLGSIEITTRYSAGLINLNKAGIPLLQALFVGLGLSRVQASQVAAALADNRDADNIRLPNGAERTEYQNAGKTAGPKNAPLESLLELEQVLGLPADFADKLRPYVTLNSGVPGLDPRYVSDELNELLRAGFNEIEALSVDAAASSPSAGRTAFPEIFISPSRHAVYEISATAVVAAGAKFKRSAVVEFNPSGSSPASILDWRSEWSADSFSRDRAPESVGEC